MNHDSGLKTQNSRLTTLLKAEARRLGFDLAGACPVGLAPGYDRFREWLEAGYAGQMDYLPRRAEAYEHPSNVLSEARSLLMLAMHYRTVDPAPLRPGHGRISRYAWGEVDYHDLIRDRLHQLMDWVREQQHDAVVRGVVDTAPLLEREYAQLAGLGWIGKNTLLLNKHSGSWFFLAALLTDLDLEYDSPHAADHCGTCRACLDACPTDAFVQPYVLDARKCVSYLTIELRESIPEKLRSGMGDWLFGCDVCQEVCPWNSKAPPSREAEFHPREENGTTDLVQLFQLDDEEFRRRFRHTPLWRARRRGILRNAAIVLGNQTPDDALDGLIRGINDEEPLVRGACAWALGQYQNRCALDALNRRQAVETNLEVLSEIQRQVGGSSQA